MAVLTDFMHQSQNLISIFVYINWNQSKRKCNQDELKLPDKYEHIFYINTRKLVKNNMMKICSIFDDYHINCRFQLLKCLNKIIQ